jgi:hypothetical protein
MSEEFKALVTLCRAATAVQLKGIQLKISIIVSPAVRVMAATVDQWRALEVRLGGVIEYGGVGAVADNVEVELLLPDATGRSKVVVREISELLEIDPRYCGAEPDEYFLLNYGWARGDVAPPEDVSRYLRVLKLAGLLRAIADHAWEAPGRSMEQLVFFAGRKLTINIFYDAADLERAPSIAVLDRLASSLLAPQHSRERRDMFKRTLVQTLAIHDEDSRFPELLRKLTTLSDTHEADVELFLSNFSFEKVKEEFQGRALEYVLKMSAASSELVTKVIAIPIGQGLLVSQMKEAPNNALANTVLWAASLIFSLLGILLVSSQRQTIGHVHNEYMLERGRVKERFPDLARRLDETIDRVRPRETFFSKSMPKLVAILLLASLVLSTIAYIRVPPFSLW